MTEPTARPWRVQPESGNYPEPYWIETDYGVEGKDYRRICRITDDWDEGKANAFFLVRAANSHDELLEAIKMVVEAPIGASDEQTCRNIKWAMLRRAIANAERKLA